MVSLPEPKTYDSGTVDVIADVSQCDYQMRKFDHCSVVLRASFLPQRKARSVYSVWTYRPSRSIGL